MAPGLKNYTTEVFGKCILAGEHAVLRGVPAIVLPVKSRSLIISFKPDTLEQLKITSTDAASEPTQVVMWEFWIELFRR